MRAPRELIPLEPPICGGFAPGAPRRAWALVSVPIWGLPLSRPPPVFGLAGRYPANNLMGRSPILGRRSGVNPRYALSGKDPSRPLPLWGISASFPALSPSRG